MFFVTSLCGSNVNTVTSTLWDGLSKFSENVRAEADGGVDVSGFFMSSNIDVKVRPARN